MPRSIFIFLILIVFQIGTSEVYAQSSSLGAQIEIVDLVFPDTTTANTTFVISGYFRNTGNVVFNGSLDVVIETTSGFSGGQASFVTGPGVGSVHLNPGDLLYFTTAVVSSTTNTTGTTENIAIVFPRANNTVCTFSPIFKNLVIQDSISNGGN